MITKFDCFVNCVSYFVGVHQLDECYICWVFNCYSYFVGANQLNYSYLVGINQLDIFKIWVIFQLNLLFGGCMPI